MFPIQDSILWWHLCLFFIRQTLSRRCALGQDTLLSQCLSPPRCINGYQRTLCWGVTLRWTRVPSRGEQKYSLSLHVTETGISSVLIGHLARMQTFFTFTFTRSFVSHFNVLVIFIFEIQNQPRQQTNSLQSKDECKYTSEQNKGPHEKSWRIVIRTR